MNPSPPDPEPASTDTAEARVLCPKCLLANSPHAAFCVDCGAPIGMVSSIDPLQRIYAEGFAYRSAVEGPPRKIVLIGMWLLFGPWTVMALWLSADMRSDVSWVASYYFLIAGVCAVVLYRTTSNYLAKSREAKAHAADEQARD